MNCVGYINNAGGYEETATRLYVDAPHPFRHGQELLVPRTRETLRVEEATPTWIRVQRGWNPSALVDDDVLCVTGSWVPDSLRPEEDWPEYDLRVDEMSGTEAREALKREARLRQDAEVRA